MNQVLHYRCMCAILTAETVEELSMVVADEMNQFPRGQFQNDLTDLYVFLNHTRLCETTDCQREYHRRVLNNGARLYMSWIGETENLAELLEIQQQTHYTGWRV
jgi:hypothetical protein